MIVVYINKSDNRLLYQEQVDEIPLLTGEENYYITEVVLMDSYIVPIFNPESQTYSEGASLGQKISVAVELKMSENASRREDGIKAYEQVASEMDVYVSMGIISSAEFDYISSVMKPVRNEIVNGRWKEGLNILVGLKPQLDDKTYNKFYKIIADYLGI